MAVDPTWLPVLHPQYCTFSPPLVQPPPFFDTASGTVRCFMNCTFGMWVWSLLLLYQPVLISIAGIHCWPIEAQELPYPDGLEKYKLFGQFLLQGKVSKSWHVSLCWLLMAVYR